MGVKKINFITIGEYIELEEASEAKHEYENGTVLAMTGGSLNHGFLCGNIYNELRTGIRNNQMSCKVVGSEVRVHIKQADAIVYPDTMVICEEINTSDEDKEAIINPLVIVEVLSKSTESYDRGDKFYKYSKLASFKEYLLIHQDKAVVETFFRTDENTWEIDRFIGLDRVVQLKSLPLSIEMEKLYDSVQFDRS